MGRDLLFVESGVDDDRLSSGDISVSVRWIPPEGKVRAHGVSHDQARFSSGFLELVDPGSREGVMRVIKRRTPGSECA